MRIDQKLKDKNFAVKCQGRILPSFVIDTFDGCELRALCVPTKKLELEIPRGRKARSISRYTNHAKRHRQ